MTTTPALIEKLRGLKGPDREVDAEIVCALYPDIGLCTPLCEGDEPIFWNKPYYKQECPKLTASLDAVVALVEREFPEVLCEMNTYGAACVYPHWIAGDVETKFPATGHTPSIALLIAFLQAKMEIGE